jgi:hypothetical protein
VISVIVSTHDKLKLQHRRSRLADEHSLILIRDSVSLDFRFIDQSRADARQTDRQGQHGAATSTSSNSAYAYALTTGRATVDLGQRLQ